MGLAGLLADPHPLAWLSGCFLGVGVGAWVAVRESPPGRVENWNLGAEGEQKTARALRTLREEHWSVIHDIQAGRGNYDHIAVGAPGVFLLETKHLRGEAYLRDGELWIRKHHDPEAERSEPAIRRQALGQARRLHDRLGAATGRKTWVQAVVVLWCPFAEELAQVGQCVFVHGPKLAECLAKQPPRLGEASRRELAAAIEDLQA